MYNILRTISMRGVILSIFAISFYNIVFCAFSGGDVIINIADDVQETNICLAPCVPSCILGSSVIAAIFAPVDLGAKILCGGTCFCFGCTLLQVIWKCTKNLVLVRISTKSA